MSTILALAGGKTSRSWILADGAATSCSMIERAGVFGDHPKLRIDPSSPPNWAAGVTGPSVLTHYVAALARDFDKNPDMYTDELQRDILVDWWDNLPDTIRNQFDDAQDKTAFNILVVAGGRVYCVDSRLCLQKYEENCLAAIGSGCEYALGAWEVLKDDNQSPILNRLRRCLTTSAHYDVWTDHPLTAKEIGSARGKA